MMLDPKNMYKLGEEILEAVEGNKDLLDDLRKEARELKSITRQIRAQLVTSLSLVGTDGGNNQIVYDPFMVQLVRVVDSSNNQYCLEALTPNTSFDILNNKHKAQNTPLWQLVIKLGLDSIEKLSPVFNSNISERSSTWIQVYREITEWAVLLTLLEKDYGTDTLIIFDGFLRSKMFASGLFGKFVELLKKEIARNYERNSRRIYLVGLAKHTKVLQSYRLAMALEGAMMESYPCYAPVPDAMKARAYKWAESYTGGSDGENFSAGTMYFIKFGKNKHDPIWAVDILDTQEEDASKIFGYLLEDAKDGFPVPFYPLSLQRAHENAAIVDFDLDILQDDILRVIRTVLDEKGYIMDELALQSTDPSLARYN